MGQQVYSLEGAEKPYRVIFEAMNEGAATITSDGTILFGNRRLAELMRTPLEKLIGASLRQFVTEADRPALDRLLDQGRTASIKGVVHLQTGNLAPVMSIAILAS